MARISNDVGPARRLGAHDVTAPNKTRGGMLACYQEALWTGPLRDARIDESGSCALDGSAGGVRWLGYSRPSRCQYGTASASPASVSAA